MALSAPTIELNYVSKEEAETVSERYEIVLNVLLSADVAAGDYILEYGIFKTDPNITVIGQYDWCDKGIEAFSTSMQGIVNQVSLRITTDIKYGEPFDANGNPIKYVILVRYIKSDGLTSPWSEPLPLRPPYRTPSITYSGWTSADPSGNAADTVYVQINPNNILPTGASLNTYPYEKIRAILTVHTSATGKSGTSWSTSEPLMPEILNGTSNGSVLQYFFDTSLNISNDTYVVANLVYATDASQNEYNVISYTSDTKESNFFIQEDPVLNEVYYYVYTDTTQRMSLSWTAPTTINDIDHYRVEGSVDPSFAVIKYSTNVLATDPSLNAIFTVNDECGVTLYWRVIADYVDESISISNTQSKNIYKHATAPQNLQVTQSTIQNGVYTSTATWSNVSLPGCGSQPQYIAKLVDKTGVVIKDSFSITYNSATDASYSVTYSDVYNDSIAPYFVEVYLETKDTNGTNSYIAGDIAKMIDSPVVVTNDYEVYHPPIGSKIMKLDWNPADTTPDYSVEKYEILLSVDGAAFAHFADVPNNVTMYLANVSAYVSDQTLSWQIKTVFNNSKSTLSNQTSPVKIFEFPSAPQQLKVTDATFTDDSLEVFNLDLTFKNPLSLGTLSLNKRFRVALVDKDGQLVPKPDGGVFQVFVIYDDFIGSAPGADKYSVTFGNVPYDVNLDSYKIVAALQILDNNSPFDYREGHSTEMVVSPVFVTNVYQVYDDLARPQIMKLDWNVADSNDDNIVSHYNVLVSLNMNDATVFASNVSANTYNADVSDGDKYTCGDSLRWQIETVYTNAKSTLSNITDPVFIFYYPTVPLDLNVTNSTFCGSNTFDATVTWKNSMNTGCGNIDTAQYVVTIKDKNGNDLLPIQEQTVAYNEALIDNYTAEFGCINYVASLAPYKVEVVLKIQDTNDSLLFVVSPAAVMTVSPVSVTNAYQVYVDISRPQVMKLEWNDAEIASGFTLNQYKVLLYANDATAPVVFASGISVSNYDADVSSYDCNAKLRWQIETVFNVDVLTKSTLSNITSEKFIYKYPTVPLELKVTNSTFTSSLKDKFNSTVTWKNSVSKGCGSDAHYIVTLVDNNGNALVPVQEHNVNYVAGKTDAYSVSFNNVVYSNLEEPYFVKVALFTTDTNSSDILNGPFAKAINAPVFITNDYQIYSADRAEVMTLSWNEAANADNMGTVNANTVIPSILVKWYEIYMSKNDGSFESVIKLGPSNTTHDVNVSDSSVYKCDDVLNFKIVTTFEYSSDSTIITSTSESNISADMQIFRYASVPQNLRTLLSYFDDSSLNTFTSTIAWTNSDSVGCGDPDSYLVNIVDKNGNSVISVTELYDASNNDINSESARYTANFSLPYNSNLAPYFAKVVLRTVDNNGHGLMNSLPASVIDSPVYLTPVYTPLSGGGGESTCIGVFDTPKLGNNPVTGLTVSIVSYEMTLQLITSSGVVSNFATKVADSAATSVAFDGVLTPANGFDCGTSFALVLKTIFSDGSTLSNTTPPVPKFRFPSGHINPVTLYSVFADGLKQEFDTKLQWTNLSDNGCNPLYYRVKIYYGGSVSNTVATQVVAFNSDTNYVYTCSLNNVPFNSANGPYIAQISLVSDAGVYGTVDLPSFNTGVDPIDTPFIRQQEIVRTINTNNELTALSFNIYSGASVTPNATLAIPRSDGTVILLNWTCPDFVQPTPDPTVPSTVPVITIKQNIGVLDNIIITANVRFAEPIPGTLQYLVELVPSSPIALNVINAVAIAASNSAGIGAQGKYDAV